MYNMSSNETWTIEILSFQPLATLSSLPACIVKDEGAGIVFLTVLNRFLFSIYACLILNVTGIPTFAYKLFCFVCRVEVVWCSLCTSWWCSYWSNCSQSGITFLDYTVWWFSLAPCTDRSCMMPANCVFLLGVLLPWIACLFIWVQHDLIMAIDFLKWDWFGTGWRWLLSAGKSLKTHVWLS